MHREGRWHGALAYREDLKKQGFSAAVAHAMTVAKFQPLDGSKAEAESAAKGRPAEQAPGKGVNLREDVEWAYHNLGRAERPRGRPPSSGARALWEWAKDNKDEFMRVFVARLLGGQVKAEEKQPAGKPNDGPIDLIDKLLTEAGYVDVRSGSEERGGEPPVPPPNP